MKKLLRFPVKGLEEQPGSFSSEAALQRWRIFPHLPLEEESVTKPTWLRQVLGRGAAQPGCVHSLGSPEGMTGREHEWKRHKHLSQPSHPLVRAGPCSLGIKSVKGHISIPWGDDPLGVLCPSPACAHLQGLPRSQQAESQGRRKRQELPLLQEQVQTHSKVQWPEEGEGMSTSKSCSSQL